MLIKCYHRSSRTFDLGIGLITVVSVVLNAVCCLPQVPQDEWSGYPGDKDEEIPCRRMRSSSYVKAMGEVDDESGDSDTSPKTSPQKAVRPDALVLKSAMQRAHFDHR